MKFLFPYMARWKAVNWTRYHQIFTRLAELGHDVYVLQPPSIKLKETNFQEIEADVPEKIHLADVEVNTALWNLKVPFNKLIKKGYYTIASRKKVKEIIQEHGIDVLFLYNIPQYPLMNGNGCIKVFDLADDYVAMLKHELGPLDNPFFSAYAQHLLEKMIDKADLTLAVSHVLAESVPGNGRTRKIEVLPNGASLDDFLLKDGNTKSVKYQKPIIGFIGAFEYFIDFDRILDIARRLPVMTFLLVGGGRDFEYVKNRSEEQGLKNVILTGPVPHSAISSYIQEMDICLNVFKDIPVSHAACPLKLFEYLLMKKPVISNRLREVERIDKDFVFYADNTDEFVSLINSILEDPATAAEYARRGYDVTLEKYTWDKITDRFLALLSEIKN